MKPQPSLSRALDFLDKSIASGTWQHGDKLPSIIRLAQQANVAKNTMSMAIENFKRQGVLSSRPSHGIFLGKPEEHVTGEAIADVSIRKAQVLAQSITNDIVTGKFGDTEFLPSYKEMQHLYGAGFRTLKEATAQLIKDKRIEPHKRNFRIVKQGRRSFANSIVLILTSGFSDLMERSVFRTRFLIFLHHLEKQCSERKLHLIQQTYINRFTNIEGFNDAAGFIVWINYAMNDIANFLLKFKKPTIFFDEHYQCNNLVKSSTISVFHQADYDAGFSQGNYLLDHGHKKACFIGLSQSPWTIKRAEGLVAAFTKAGMPPDSVTLNFSVQDEQNQKSTSNLNAADLQWQQSLAEESRQFHTIQQMVRTTIRDVTKRESLAFRLGDFEGLADWQLRLLPLVNQTLAGAGVTALVAEDDYVGVMVLDYLKHKRIPVPQNISVVGFNNQIEAFSANLTSYDFNMPAIVGKMMDVMFWPRKKVDKGENRTIEVEGFIAVRGSSAEVRL